MLGAESVVTQVLLPSLIVLPEAWAYASTHATSLT